MASGRGMGRGRGFGRGREKISEAGRGRGRPIIKIIMPRVKDFRIGGSNGTGQVWGKGRCRGGCTRDFCQHVKRYCRIHGGKGNATGLGRGKCEGFFQHAKRCCCRRQ